MSRPPPAALWPRSCLVGAIVATVAGSFLYAGGWLSPRRLTPARFIDTFERVNGVAPGFRRNHAKGVCVRGTFEANGLGSRLSRATVFEKGMVPVVGRFALAGGKPYAADAVQSVRSMALQFRLRDGEEWRTGMNAIPVFAVATPQAFHDQLEAFAPDPATGRADPSRVKAFLEQYPETARAIQRIKAQPPTAGFDDSTYGSLNAFELVDAKGVATSARWAMVPEPRPPAAVHAAASGPNFLFDALIERVRREPIRWHLVMTIGHADDPTNDATVEWPPDREKVDVGTLTIDQIESEETGAARTINFDPLVLPDGIAPSDDPLLSARSAAYSVSFRRRMGEAVTPSAVTRSEAAQ